MASQQPANTIDCRSGHGREQVATSIPVVSHLAQRLLKEGFISDGHSSIGKTEALLWAVEHKHVPLVDELIAYGADVNIPAADGWTCLGLAAQLPTPEILDILLRAGADVTAICSVEGHTALHWAAGVGRSQAVKTLISHGSKVDARTSTLGFCPLHQAADKGHVETIQALLEAGANVECADDEGWTPLYTACRSGHPDAVQLLIDRGASISSITTEGWTPLHVAAIKAKHEIVKQLLESGANVNAVGGVGTSVLGISVIANSVATAQVLLDHGADMEINNSNGIAPLSSAVLGNALEMVSFLLNHGADIEGQTDDGYTALHLAAQSNLRQMSQLLIEKSANIESRTAPWVEDGGLGDEGLTPLLVAARYMGADAAHILINHGANANATANGWTGIHFASVAQSKSLIRSFAQEGVSIDARTLANGDTALIVASAGGNPEVVTLLIKLGADVNATNNIGWTALHFAAHGGFEEIVGTLLESGADPATRSLDGECPRDVAYRQQNHHVKELIEGGVSVSLDAQNKSRAGSVSLLFLAARNGHLAKILQILDGETDINSCDMDGRSPLSLAAESGWIDIVKALTSRKADMNLQDSYDGTPIWWASKRGHTIVVKHLLEQGAHCDTPDAEGQSPLSVSSQYGHLATARMLLECGADPNSFTNYGKTPLMFAVDNGQLAAVELLLDSGAEVNYRNSKEDSALRLAEMKKDKQISDVLKAHPSFIKSESDQWDEGKVRGRSYLRKGLDSISPLASKVHASLLEASKKGQLAMIKRLIKAGADPNLSIDHRSALDAAAAFGQCEAVARLVKHGASVNGNDIYRSPLMSAAFAGHSNVIKLLCDLGATVDRGHEWGYSALMDAAERGHEAATSLLLQLGAKTETRDKNGRTPLWHATNKRFGNVVKLLVESGANLECADNTGCTPLMVAVKRRDRKLTQFLLEKGSQMRPESENNHSPLCYAAKKGDEAIVDLLLDYGADVNFLSDEKRTALHIATLEGHIMVLNMLIEANADVSLKDADGRTALSLAKENANEAAIRLLCQSGSLRDAYSRQGKKAEETSFNEKSFYKYQPLTMEHSIRIIELHPGNPGEILSFELEEVLLASSPSFDALSYEWQERIGTVPVQCDDRKILITSNCKAAMEKLRLRTKSRCLWIDAICINQADDHERNQQVAIMGEIFRAADKVIMWLGEETESTAEAFEELPMVAKAQRKLLQETRELAADGESSEEDKDHRIMLQRMSSDDYIIGAFEELMSRTYWTRAWILPEIIIAGSRGIVMCGNQSCDWSTLRLGIPRYRFCGLDLTPAIFDSPLVDKYENKGELPLAAVVDVLHTLNATDIRDKVFAALGVASSAKVLLERPVADYTMSVQQVYVYATRYIIDSHGLWWAWKLGIRHSTKEVSGLPSWVPDFNQRTSNEGQELFGCSSVLCHLDIAESPVTTDISLQIGGCILDRVVFKFKLTKDLDISTIILLIVEALEKRGQSIYDVYQVGGGFDINNTIGDRKDRTQSIRSLRMTTNAGALLDTIFRLTWLPCGGDDEMKTDEDIADEAFSFLLGYMVWTLSRKVDALEPPEYAKQAANPWFEEFTNAEAFNDFEIDNLVLMEGLLRYGKDLIYTQNGYFGLANSGEAEDDMSIALVGNDPNFRLLRKREASKPYYEYVDLVSINFMGQEIDKPEKAYKNIILERLEFR